MSPESDAYAKHKNLKIAASEIGIPWQTLYYRLKKQGVAVTGDKARYGSKKDRMAANAEAMFQRLVPWAKDTNMTKWQAKYDFDVGPIKVDVKASHKNLAYAGRPNSLRWAFLFTRQTYICDFIVCMCLNDDESIEAILIIPKEIFSGITTLSFPAHGGGKWSDFVVPEGEVEKFFSDMKEITKAD